jgi:uncharacterized protein
LTVARRRIAALLAAAACLALAASAQDLTAVVAAPDGTGLATDVYLPFLGGVGPWPVILQRTPYGRDGLGATCRGFNLLGYACVAQDVRGRGGSEGTDTVFRDDGPDGRATLDWIAAQPWCNGKIATFGASALGITQYALAPGAPTALVALAPMVATPDFYHDAAYEGGALRQALTYDWLAKQDNLAMYEEVRAHRLWDAWWAEAAILPHVAEVETPALHVGGWYDIFLQGTLDAYDDFQHDGGDGARGRQRLIIGPWTHDGIGQTAQGELTYPANAALDLFSVMSAWYDHWLTGGSQDVDSWPAVEVYLMGAVGEPGAPGNTWVDLPDWPPPARTQPLFLATSGGLADSPAGADRVELTIDPAEPTPTLGGRNLFADLVVDGRPMGAGPYDQRPIEARPDVAAFTTAPLASPLAVMGRVRARLWIVPDTPDLDLTVRLTDVYPDGRSMLVADGIQRARMRCGDEQECFLSPGVPTEIVVDLWSTAIVFAAGHRVRIDVAGSNAPRFEVNPNDGGSFDAPLPRIARPALLLGGHHPSRLDLPVVVSSRLPRRHLSH